MVEQEQGGAPVSRVRSGVGAPSRPLVFAITVTGILTNTLVGPVVPDMLVDFGQPSSRAGLFVAAAALPGIVMAPVIGVLADRLGRRAVLLPCLTVFGVMGLASTVAPSFEVLLALRVLQGVGAAGLINLAIVLIGDHWEGRERVQVVGQNSAVLTAALAVLPLLGGLLGELGGWRATYVVHGSGLVAAWWVWRRLERGRPTETVTLGSQLAGIGPVLRDRRILGAVGLGFVVFVWIYGLALTVLPLHLADTFGLGAGARGAVMALPAVAATATALALARLRDRFGIRTLVRGALTAVAVGLALMGTAPHLGVLALGALVYGAAEGLLIPTLQETVASAAPQQQRGAAMASWTGAARLGQSVGPIGGSSLYGGVGAAWTFAAGAGAALAMMVLARVAPRGRAAAAGDVPPGEARG